MKTKHHPRVNEGAVISIRMGTISVDGECGKANQKFVHNQAQTFSFAEIAVRLSDESRQEACLLPIPRVEA
jgi:hypothetical protein